MSRLKAPFPYYGGKSRVADLVWSRLGHVGTYIEPFAGSLAVLLACPAPAAREYASDLDGLVCNFWRAMRSAPSEVADAMNHPMNHHDVVAWRARLRAECTALEARVRADTEYFDTVLAGRWAWVVSSSICWANNLDGRPSWGFRGCHGQRGTLAWCIALAERLRHVAMYAVDWEEMVSVSILAHNAGRAIGVFFDPPYDSARRARGIYRHDESMHEGLISWCREHEALRVCLAGLPGEYDLPDWDVVMVAGGRECLWFSPGCLQTSQISMWGDRDYDVP